MQTISSANQSVATAATSQQSTAPISGGLTMTTQSVTSSVPITTPAQTESTTLQNVPVAGYFGPRMIDQGSQTIKVKDTTPVSSAVTPATTPAATARKPQTTSAPLTPSTVSVPSSVITPSDVSSAIIMTPGHTVSATPTQQPVGVQSTPTASTPVNPAGPAKKGDSPMDTTSLGVRPFPPPSWKQGASQPTAGQVQVAPVSVSTNVPVAVTHQPASGQSSAQASASTSLTTEQQLKLLERQATGVSRRMGVDVEPKFSTHTRRQVKPYSSCPEKISRTGAEKPTKSAR